MAGPVCIVPEQSECTTLLPASRADSSCKAMRSANQLLRLLQANRCASGTGAQQSQCLHVAHSERIGSSCIGLLSDMNRTYRNPTGSSEFDMVRPRFARGAIWRWWSCINVSGLRLGVLRAMMDISAPENGYARAYRPRPADRAVAAVVAPAGKIARRGLESAVNPAARLCECRAADPQKGFHTAKARSRHPMCDSRSICGPHSAESANPHDLQPDL